MEAEAAVAGLDRKIAQAGDYIRQLKVDKAPKDAGSRSEGSAPPKGSVQREGRRGRMPMEKRGSAVEKKGKDKKWQL